MDHTPTPWHISISHLTPRYIYGPANKDGHCLAVGSTVTALGAEYDAANAAFIVRACNAHDDVVEVLRDLLDATANHTSLEDERKRLPGILAAARTALAKAEDR